MYRMFPPALSSGSISTSLQTEKATHNERTYNVELYVTLKYHIRSNYRTYPYKRLVKRFRSLHITASVLFVYFMPYTYIRC